MEKKHPEGPEESNVHNINTTCLEKKPGSYLKGQGHKLRSKVIFWAFVTLL